MTLIKKECLPDFDVRKQHPTEMHKKAEGGKGQRKRKKESNFCKYKCMINKGKTRDQNKIADRYKIQVFHKSSQFQAAVHKTSGCTKSKI